MSVIYSGRWKNSVYFQLVKFWPKITDLRAIFTPSTGCNTRPRSSPARSPDHRPEHRPRPPDHKTVAPPACTAPSGWPRVPWPFWLLAPRQPSRSRHSPGWRYGSGSAPPRSCPRPEPASPCPRASNLWGRGRTMNRPMLPVSSSSTLYPHSAPVVSGWMLLRSAAVEEGSFGCPPRWPAQPPPPRPPAFLPPIARVGFCNCSNASCLAV